MKKKQIRKMQQGCCNVDNYQRMSTKSGEKASKGADMIREMVI